MKSLSVALKSDFKSLVLSFILFSTFSLLAPPSAQADFYIHRWEDLSEAKGFSGIRSVTHYYYTQYNFDPIGTITTPSGLQSYARLQSDLIYKYGLSETFSFFGRFSFAYLNIKGSIRQGSRFGLADQTVGISAKLYEAVSPTSVPLTFPTVVRFQIQTDFPGYNNSTVNNTQAPYLGDGTIDTTGGLFVSFPFSNSVNNHWGATLGGGFTYRSQNFSSAIPWTAALLYYPRQEGAFADLTASGFTSLKTDLNGSSGISSRSPTGSGGSFYTGGINPSLINLTGRVGYRTSSEFEAWASATQSVWGQDTPVGFIFLAGIQLRIGSKDSANPALIYPSRFDHSNRGFQSYSIDAKILKVNERLNLVKINKGSQDNIKVGDIFDIFMLNADGTFKEPVARAEVTHVKFGESALEIVEFFKDEPLDEKFLAKKLIQ